MEYGKFYENQSASAVKTIMIYIKTDSHDAKYYFALEKYLMDKGGEYFLFWNTAPTLMLGRYQNAHAEINLAHANECGIEVVRRLTGGGAIFTDENTWQFSYIVKNNGAKTFDFSLFTQPILNALKALGVNAMLKGRNDLISCGKKLSGNAQLLTKDAILHHGSLLFDTDLEMLEKALTPHAEKFSTKGIRSVRQRVITIKELLPEPMTNASFYGAMLGELTRDMQPLTLSNEENKAVEDIWKNHFSTWEWNYGKNPSFNVVKERRFTGGALTVRLAISLASCNFFNSKPGEETFTVDDIASFKETFLNYSSGYTFHVNANATERDGSNMEMDIDEKYEASTAEQGDKLKVTTKMAGDSSSSDITATKYYVKGLSHMNVGEFYEMPSGVDNGYNWYIKTMENKTIADLQTAKTPQILLFLEKTYYSYDETEKKFFVNDSSGLVEQFEELTNTNDINVISLSLEFKNQKQEVFIKFVFESEEYSTLEYTITIKNLQNTKVTLPNAYDGTNDRLNNFVLDIRNTNDYVVSINYYLNDELVKTEKREKLQDKLDNGTVYYSLEIDGVKTYSKEMFVSGSWKYFDYINSDWVQKTEANVQTEDVFSYDFLGGYMLVDSMSFNFIPNNLNYKISNSEQWSPNMQTIYFSTPTSYIEVLIDFEVAQEKGIVVLKAGTSRVEITLLSSEVANAEDWPVNQ